jgi:hypothetical protein
LAFHFHPIRSTADPDHGTRFRPDVPPPALRRLFSVALIGVVAFSTWNVCQAAELEAVTREVVLRQTVQSRLNARDYPEQKLACKDDTHLHAVGAFRICDLAIIDLKAKVPELAQSLKQPPRLGPRFSLTTDQHRWTQILPCRTGILPARVT